jgi:hypothetical protein
MSEPGIVTRKINRAGRAAIDRLAAFGVATMHERWGASAS